MKRLFLTTILIIICLFIFPSLASAATVPDDMSSYTQALSPKAEVNLVQQSGAGLLGDISVLNCAFTGAFDDVCTYTDATTGQVKPIFEHAAIPEISHYVAYMSTQPPAHVSTYIADLLHNGFGLAQPAYAQGFGFSALEPILQVWKAFRNLTYFLFVLIFIAVGFMIMFRAQINPQTVVTIQSALPKLVVTLILITFSYAIAGLVVDLIYLTIFLTTALFQANGLLVDSNTASNALLSRTLFALGWQHLMGAGDVAGHIAGAIGNLVNDALSGQGSIFLRTVGAVVGGGASVIGYFIIAAAILFSLLRAGLTLLKAYIGLILNIIFSPVQILFNALPNSSAFTDWLKSLLANAAVFPATAIMLLLGIILAGGSNRPTMATPEIAVPEGIGYGGYLNLELGGPSGFVPPFVLPGNVNTVDAIKALIALGIIMLLPEVLTIVKETLGVKDPLSEMATESLKQNLSYANQVMRFLLGPSQAEKYTQRGFLRRKAHRYPLGIRPGETWRAPRWPF
jgi:hypothetical protein